jgi:hypothetical protein
MNDYNYEGMSLHDVARRMKDLGEQDKELADAKAEVYKEWDYIRKIVIPSMMEEQKIERISFKGIGRVQLASDMYTSTIDGDGLAYWLVEHDAGELIKPTVNGSTLKSYIRNQLEIGGEIPSEFVNITPFTRASIVKG